MSSFVRYLNTRRCCILIFVIRRTAQWTVFLNLWMVFFIVFVVAAAIVNGITSQASMKICRKNNNNSNQHQLWIVRWIPVTLNHLNDRTLNNNIYWNGHWLNVMTTERVTFVTNKYLIFCCELKIRTTLINQLSRWVQKMVKRINSKCGSAVNPVKPIL